MQNNNQQFNQLKLKFIQLDSNGDGFINNEQLQNFMKTQQLFHVQVWKINEAMAFIDNKMNQENFIVWIMGCRIHLEDFAIAKFKFSKMVEKSNSAGPGIAPSQVKKSSINFAVNTPQQSKSIGQGQYLKLVAGIDQQLRKQKNKQISSVLGHDPSDIYISVKFRADQKGTEVAQKLAEIIEFGLGFVPEIGPLGILISESLITMCKYQNGFVYIVLELNSSFFNTILNCIDEALYTLSPECKALLQVKIISDFTNILKKNFDALKQVINLSVDFEIDGTTLSKLKQNLVKDFEFKTDDQKLNIMFMFLFEELKLDSSFSDLKDCFKSLGIDQHMIPQPFQLTGQIKNAQIQNTISQLIPQGSQLLNNLKDNCKPQGHISINGKNIGIDISFNLNVQGAFDLL